MRLRRPVITGTGIICAAGRGVREVWDSIRTAQSGLGGLTLFAAPRYAHHLVGQVRQDVGALAGGVRGGRSDKLGWIAAQEALAHAGLALGLGAIGPERVGVVLGATVGGMLGTEQVLIELWREERRRFGPLRFHECAGATDLCARQLGARGPCVTLATACSAGALAIALAGELIETGEADLVLAGGSDSLCRLTLNGFGSLLLLDPNGCRPFDARRAGISLGEGAAMLVVEAEETARARGARILARLAGTGVSCDAWHATAPHPAGHGAFAAMQRALAQSGLAPADIDYVSAHGTGTPDNDVMEARALRRLFGERLPPVASVMRFFGHTLAASGAIKAVVCVEALQEQALPPNPGFEQPDPNVGFQPVKEFCPQRLAHVLSNSFGFGGNNVALVLSHTEAVPRPRPAAPAASFAGHVSEAAPRPVRLAAPASRRFAVVGAGVVSAAGSTLAAVQAAFRHGGAALSLYAVPAAMPPGRARVYASGDFGAEKLFEPGRRRKLSRLQQMVLAATRQSLPAQAAASTTPERVCVALGTGLGCLNDTAAFLEKLLRKDAQAPRPLFFTNSVHNSLAAQVAIELNLTGLNSTPVQRELSFETALWQGANELALGRADLALAGAADELNQYLLAAGMRWGWWLESTPAIRPFSNALSGRQRALRGEGCAVFTLARSEQASRPLAWVSAIRIGRCENGPGSRFDAPAEAQWIRETLEREEHSLAELDLLLTGANGWAWLDRAFQAVGQELSRLAGRRIPCGAYKHCCGEHHSASAFGFLAAIELVRGEIQPADCAWTGEAPPPAHRACRTVVLYTLAPTGTKGMCCVRA